MDEMMKIIRMNGYIQRKLGKLYLNGQEVTCVALDRTCTFEDMDVPEVELTDEQLNDLFRQTFGAEPARAKPPAQE